MKITHKEEPVQNHPLIGDLFYHRERPEHIFMRINPSKLDGWFRCKYGDTKFFSLCLTGPHVGRIYRTTFDDPSIVQLEQTTPLVVQEAT
jgi:hypothetical protein